MLQVVNSIHHLFCVIFSLLVLCFSISDRTGSIEISKVLPWLRRRIFLSSAVDQAAFQTSHGRTWSVLGNWLVPEILLRVGRNLLLRVCILHKLTQVLLGNVESIEFNGAYIVLFNAEFIEVSRFLQFGWLVINCIVVEQPGTIEEAFTKFWDFDWIYSICCFSLAWVLYRPAFRNCGQWLKRILIQLDCLYHWKWAVILLRASFLIECVHSFLEVFVQSLTR